MTSTGWRYYAQHPTTGEFLDTEAPLSKVTLTRRLSGPWGMSASIEPETARALAADGSRLYTEWGVQFWAERDGVIRGGGVLTSSVPGLTEWALTCEGHARYPYGVPYLGSFSGVKVDPFDAFREVWRHVQSFPDGNLGVVVDRATTGGAVTLGLPEVAAYWEVSFSPEGTASGDMVWVRESSVAASRIDKPANAVLEAAIEKGAGSFKVKNASDFTGVATPFTVKIGSESIRVRARTGATFSNLIRGWDPATGDGKPSKASGHAKGSKVTYAGTPRRKIEKKAAEPYVLAWYEAPDCGDELDTLARETPFEYLEAHEWAGDKIAHRIRLGYPRVGRRRTDIAFVEGENLAFAPELDRDGDEFAQYVIGLGAGEGRKRVHTPLTGSPDGRLRRPHVLDRTDVTTSDRLARLVAAELRARTLMASVPEVAVRDHPNAPLGSWELGDEVEVHLTGGWADDSVWCRIVEETIAPETSDRVAVLKLSRADGL